MSTTGRETIPRAILCVDVYNCHVSKVYDVIRSTIFTAQNLQCIMWLTGYIESIFRPEYPERGQLHPSDFAAARLSGAAIPLQLLELNNGNLGWGVCLWDTRFIIISLIMCSIIEAGKLFITVPWVVPNVYIGLMIFSWETISISSTGSIVTSKLCLRWSA